LNLRPPASQTGALPGCAILRYPSYRWGVLYHIREHTPAKVVLQNDAMQRSAKMVGVVGFEPTTPGTQNRCATRLRHTPREGSRYPPNRPFLLSHQPVGRGSLCIEMREPCCENKGFDATRMSSCKDLVFAIHGWSPTSSDRNPSGRVGFIPSMSNSVTQTLKSGPGSDSMDLCF
jgi:hypothetical protein